MIMTNGELKKLFPEYSDEIDELQKWGTCPCSICTWKTLESRHSLELPDKYKDPYMAWG